MSLYFTKHKAGNFYKTKLYVDLDKKQKFSVVLITSTKRCKFVITNSIYVPCLYFKYL